MEKDERNKNNKGTKSTKVPSRIRPQLLSSLLLRSSAVLFSIRLVYFSNWLYIVLTVAVSSIFWIVFNVFDQLLFFSPVFVFYLPDDAVIGFILSTITAVLMGIVVGMNVYIVKHSFNLKTTIGSLFSGSTLSIFSSTCASCSSVGFLLVSTFGGIGITTSAFLSNYQTPLRVISIALLVWALYSASSKLTKSCVLDRSMGSKVANNR
jgi:hypothetical protein